MENERPNTEEYFKNSFFPKTIKQTKRWIALITFGIPFTIFCVNLLLVIYNIKIY